MDNDARGGRDCQHEWSDALILANSVWHEECLVCHERRVVQPVTKKYFRFSVSIDVEAATLEEAYEKYYTKVMRTDLAFMTEGAFDLEGEDISEEALDEAITAVVNRVRPVGEES